MNSKRYAAGIAWVAPMLALALMLVSARSMAAPQPPQTPTFVTRHPSSVIQPCFYRERQLACVSRLAVQAIGSPQDQARALLQALIEGPTPAERASGLRSALPDGTQLADVTVTGDAVTVRLVLPEAFLYGNFNPLLSDEITEQIIKTLYPLGNLRQFNVLAFDPRDSSVAFKPLSYFLFEPPPVHKTESSVIQPSSLVTPHSSLAGKAIYLSAGHGWYWSSYWQEWRTQRYADGGYQLIEDMNNAEVVNQYLIQYLRNAGADVWPVREHDMNTQDMIVIHDRPGYTSAGHWYTSTLPGYQSLSYYYTHTVTSTATATATWTFTPTASGRYAVYVWYSSIGSDPRTPDAQYFVVHQGGITEIRVNQQMHGFTWRYIGTFPFTANTPGQVILTNHSDISGTVVVADSIRVGGGMGTEYGDGPPPSPSTSGKPRWEEAARYWAKYQGAPPEVYAPSYCPDDGCQDVTARPRYAEWEHESSQDSIFVSWHSNAYNGSARGTESYIYNGEFSPGSDQLQHWIHTTLVQDIRAGWDASWPDRGLKRADFGELRPLSTMPGTLLEIAFHDQPDDANALKDPRFAQLTARAVYKGIVRYFSETQSTPLVILPEPPQNLIVRSSGPGQVTVSWRPSPTDTIGLLGDAATGYRVYTSTDGFGWNSGINVTNTTALTLTGLAAEQLIFVRVTAINAGGESFPTPVAAVRVANSGPAPLLIVNGYERIDRWMDIERCDTPVSANCPNKRLWPAQMNDQSYIIQHAMAISLPFDSAVRAAVNGGDIALGAYDIVDWIAGQEQTPAPFPKGTTEVALTQAEQDALTAYLSSGHALFISGAELAFDLAENLNRRSFLTGTLRAEYVRDDANTFAVTPTVNGILSGLESFNFDDGSHGSYAVDWPDVITPTNGSTATLRYVGGTGGTAAIEYADGCQRLVYFGFPFETIYPAAARQAVMARIISFLNVCSRRPPVAVILAPVNGGFYRSLPNVSGSVSDYAPVSRVDVALVQITTPLRFLSDTTWITSETWIPAAGGAAWVLTPAVTLADGPYAVWARAWNSYGLSSTQNAIVSFTIDTVSPTAPIPITPTGGITLTDFSVTVIFSSSFDANGVAGYNVLVDGQLYTTTATILTLTNILPGLHMWQVRAFDAAGNVSDWMTATFVTNPFLIHLPIVMRDYSPPPPAPQCQELVRNGGFETTDAWYSLSGVKPTYVYSPGNIVHSGLASLLIGYTTTANAPADTVYSSIQQTITIPLTATQTTLTFWRYPVSSDSRDFQYVAVGPSPTNVTTIWTRKSNEQMWLTTTIDLSAYSGALTIRLGVVNQVNNGVTAMYLDDVSVQTCSYDTTP